MHTLIDRELCKIREIIYRFMKLYVEISRHTTHDITNYQ
jgi:hypothetical protein